MSRVGLAGSTALRRLHPSLQSRGLRLLPAFASPAAQPTSSSRWSAARALTLTQAHQPSPCKFASCSRSSSRPPQQSTSARRTFHSSAPLQSIHYWPAHVISNLHNNNKARNLFSTQRENKKVRDILRVLYDEGYIAGFSKHPEKEGFLRVHMKYDEHGHPAIHEIKSVSRPGKRVFQSVYEIRVFQKGLGTVVVGTQQGIMTVDEARRRRLGGEVLFHIS